MRPALHTRLTNGPFDDAGLYIQFRFQKRAIMFDLGEIHSLSAREILKITHVFVSHTHIDHFAGFDRLLRLMLGRGNTVHLYGPPRFAANVAGKLAGYTWNLLTDSPNPLTFQVTEVHPTTLQQHTFASNNSFKPQSPPREEPFRACLWSEPEFSVNCAILDHQTPCLAFSLQERFHVNIMVNRLSESGLRPGPWLTDFKRALHEEQHSNTRFTIPANCCQPPHQKQYALDTLARAIARITPGQKISYVVDAAGHPVNVRRIVDLVRGADQLFIETAFLDSDQALAQATSHLTAHQAGQLAAQAGVKQIIPFHFSSRYIGQQTRLTDEIEAAFSVHRRV